MTHILRFDTQVEGFDSEIGFPVMDAIRVGEIETHQLPEQHFFSTYHHGSTEKLRETTRKIYTYMNYVGLSPALEIEEIYHKFDLNILEDNIVEVRVSFLPWPELFLSQLHRVLGDSIAETIWAGGESITPFTPVDERVMWVAEALERLKLYANPTQQFEILSRVSLTRPMDDVAQFKKIYKETGDVSKLLETLEAKMAAGPSRLS